MIAKVLYLSYMEKECYQKLQRAISRFPSVHQFLDNDFIKKQCKKGLKSYILLGLAGLIEGRTSQEVENHLPSLEKRLGELAPLTGYCRLKPLLRGASDWDEYQEFLAQIDVTLWFKNKNILKEIEPELPHREGIGDILLSFLQQDIYCEVAAFQSLIKSLESKTANEENKIQSRLQELRKGQPWLTKQDVENEIEINKIVRNLLEKTKKQLPPKQPSILALDTGKAGVFHHQISTVASRLFQNRKQVVLIMLCSLEGGSGGNPPFWFINPNSPFQDIGQELLKYLGQENKVLDCK